MERKFTVAPAMPAQGAANQNVKENVYEKDLHVRTYGISDAGACASGRFRPAVRAGRAEQGSQAKALSFEQTASSAAPQRLLPEATEPESQAPDYANTDLVRVSIVLDRASTIGAGYATSGIAANASAMSYRDSLKQEQAGMTASIERATGNRLDVVWNLTLAANLISANIPYGQLSAIQALPGVREVILENRYDPAVYSVDEPDSPNMSTSCDMIGSAAAWACGSPARAAGLP